MTKDSNQKTDYELLGIKETFQNGHIDFSSLIDENEFVQRHLPLVLTLIDHIFVEGESKVPKTTLISCGLDVLKDARSHYNPYTSGF